jgi:hypothetical protein
MIAEIRRMAHDSFLCLRRWVVAVQRQLAVLPRNRAPLYERGMTFPATPDEPPLHSGLLSHAEGVRFWRNTGNGMLRRA